MEHQLHHRVHIKHLRTMQLRTVSFRTILRIWVFVAPPPLYWWLEKHKKWGVRFGTAWQVETAQHKSRKNTHWMVLVIFTVLIHVPWTCENITRIAMGIIEARPNYYESWMYNRFAITMQAHATFMQTRCAIAMPIWFLPADFLPQPRNQATEMSPWEMLHEAFEVTHSKLGEFRQCA